MSLNILNLKTFRKWKPQYYLLIILFLLVAFLKYMTLHPNITDLYKENMQVITPFKECERIPVKGEFMSSSRYKCYLDSLKQNVDLYGFVKTAQAFDQYINQTDQADIRGACHSWAHELGESAVRNGSSGEDVIKSCVQTCLDGCFNGAGHAYVATNQDLSNVNNFCNPKGMSVDDKKKDACFHGIGHGIVDVFGTEIEKVIKHCNLINDKEGKAQCSHAIFMLFNTVTPSRVDINGIPENMVNFCKSLDSAYQNYCYDFSGYLTYGRSKEVKNAFINCSGVPSKNKLECFRRIGDILYLMNPQKQSSLIAQQCKAGASEENLWCSLGIAKLLITDGNNFPEKSFEVCLLFDGELKLSCYKELGEQLESHRSRKDRERLCGLLDEPFSKVCLNK